MSRGGTNPSPIRVCAASISAAQMHLVSTDPRA